MYLKRETYIIGKGARTTNKTHIKQEGTRVNEQTWNG